MPFSEYSTNPSANTTIGGKFVGEDCPPGNINDAIRQLAADGKDLSNTVGAGSAAMPKSGGEFTGDIVRAGRGGYLHHANPAQSDGRLVFKAQGSSRPAAAEGMIVFYY
ncbi:hypothetical protein [Sphingomonas japonica]|uniref:Uncharacterized protein n=1 Tax=Sphingomonas japonica TaxID=511662 RepID=A0ABX0U2N6_9SPHN|nr:hypothetical protein [Sphingomonas japonica]NIJ24841.1 hypothetical protein [Sphingomonas japonica]